jgi:hypothetical protein
MNQTRPHFVNQMEKTHSKPLVARHGRGTAWARHAMCESAFNLGEVPFRYPLHERLGFCHDAIGKRGGSLTLFENEPSRPAHRLVNMETVCPGTPRNCYYIYDYIDSHTALQTYSNSLTDAERQAFLYSPWLCIKIVTHPEISK